MNIVTTQEVRMAEQQAVTTLPTDFIDLSELQLAVVGGGVGELVGF